MERFQKQQQDVAGASQAQGCALRWVRLKAFHCGNALFKKINFFSFYLKKTNQAIDSLVAIKNAINKTIESQDRGVISLCVWIV